MKNLIVKMLILAAGTAIAANAQSSSINCQTTVGPSRIIRTEGQAELVSDLLMTCVGGTPTGTGLNIPQANITVFLNTNVTSRTLSSPYSEALLLIDEPAPAIQLPCGNADGICPITGTGNGIGVYNGAKGRPNVFQARLAGTNSLSWLGVPIDPPGQGPARVLRITDVRVAGLTGAIQMFVSINGASSIPLNNPTQTVATGQAGMRVSVKNVVGNSNGLAGFTVNFTEGFASVYKTRTAATFAGANTSPPPVNQDTVGTLNLGSETGFYSAAYPVITGRGNLGVAGLADHGTRLMMTFSNVPPGVGLAAPLTATVVGAVGATGVARLVSIDSSGAGPFAAATSTQIPVFGGSALIAYEIMQTSPQGVESVDVPITVSYSAGATLSSLQISAGLGPLTNISTADANAPLPRFNSPTSLTVAAPLAIITTALQDTLTGAAYSVQLQAVGGSTPYTWSSTGLPAGLTLNGGGLISGAATIAGTYSIPFTVTDAIGRVASVALTLNVAPSLQIVNPTLPDGTAGTLYLQTIRMSGGVAPYTFALVPNSPIVPNALPDGLTLSLFGTVSGLPTTPGSYSFKVTVTDNRQAQTTGTINLVILAGLSITTASPLPQAAVGVLYTQTITAGNGTPPYKFTFAGAPLAGGFTLSAAGILSGTATAAGTFSFIVQVTDNLNAIATKTFQLTVAVIAPLLQVSQVQLDFVASTDGDSPPSQTISVSATGLTSVAFSIKTDGGSVDLPVPTWLKGRFADSTTPGLLVLNAVPTGLKAGIYSARLRVQAGDLNQNPVDVAVRLTISDVKQALEVNPKILSFAARFAAPGPMEQVLLVRNLGGGKLKFTASAVDAPWITSITPDSGETAPDAPVYLTVRINTSGLDAGGFRGIVRVASAAGSADLPVRLFVSPPGPVLSVNVTGLRFRGRIAQGSATPQSINVINVGDPGTSVNWKAELISGADLLTISTPAGISRLGVPAPLTLVPSTTVVNLPVGPQYAVVRISDPNARNSPQYVVAVLDLTAADSVIIPDPVPAGLLFTTGPGTAPPPQTVTLWNNSNAAVPFQVFAATDDGAKWISVSPASGTATSTAPGRTSVSINTTILTPGVYTGSVNFAIGGAVRSTKITAVVSSVAVGDASTKIRAATCNATKLSITETGTPNNFSVPAGWPTTLSVKLTDDCANPVAGASVSASFSNGDPPISLIGDGIGGTFARSWRPGNSGSQIAVTVDAVAPGVPAIRTQITGTVGPNSKTAPVLAANGTLNNLNPKVGAPLAPNTVAQVFGTGLASTIVSPGVVPLVTEFNATSMLVGPFLAPLYYLSPTQLTVQLPAELAPINEYPVLVYANGIPTLVPDVVTLNAAEPGMAQFFDGSGLIIAQHGADFALVTAANPAKAGEALIIYLAGMGATSPAVASAQRAPGVEPLARVTTAATVTVDGQNSSVFYSGLTPFGIGLYQINFLVPANARSGNLDVIVRQGSGISNTAKLQVK